jgi:N-acetylglucosamine-6-phosphate deacetylase
VRLGVASALIDGQIVPGDVDVDDGVVTGVGLASPGRCGLAAPGFVDLQVNGVADVDLLLADADGFHRAGEVLLEAGVTAFQPTFVTAPEPELVAALRAMPREACGPRILGAHLEGPFLSPRRLGAHDPAGRRDPDVALLERLLAAGPVSQVTLAPELPAALELVDALVARGVTVSCGHSDATAEQAHRAFDRGARTVTHLFNAMRPSSARDPGLAFAALARGDVSVQVVADGRHVAPEALRVAWASAAGRLALVTDAVAAAGLGGTEVVADGGVLRRPDGTLAGSTLTMPDAVRALHGLGVPVERALQAASAVPARIAGRPELGRLAVGGPADVVVLDDALDVVRVLVGGAERVAA